MGKRGEGVGIILMEGGGLELFYRLTNSVQISRNRWPFSLKILLLNLSRVYPEYGKLRWVASGSVDSLC